MVTKIFFNSIVIFSILSALCSEIIIKPDFFYDGEFDADAATKSLPIHMIEQKLVCDGMEFIRFKCDGPQVVGCGLIIDPQKISIEAESSKWVHRLEKVSSMAARRGALAAINGSFYRSNRTFCANPVSTLKIEDIFYADLQFSRGVLAWNKNGKDIYLGRMKIDWTLKIGKKKYRVDRINQPRGSAEAIVYNSAFRSRTFTNNEGVEFVIADGVVKNIISTKGNSSIPAKGFIYSVHEKSGVDVSAIQVGSKAKLSYTTSLLDASPEYERAHQKFDYIVGAGPTMLINGVVSSFEQMDQELFSGKPMVKFHGETVGGYHDRLRHRHWLIDKYHPRTAVGKRPDGRLVFIVVDGRIPNYSRGVNLYELGNILQQLGCTDGVNLDGGGASILLLDGQTKNLLAGSDLDELIRINMSGGIGLERSVGNAILFFQREVPSKIRASTS